VAARGLTMPTTAGWLIATTIRRTTGTTTTVSVWCLPYSSERDGFPYCEQIFILQTCFFVCKYGAREAFYRGSVSSFSRIARSKALPFICYMVIY